MGRKQAKRGRVFGGAGRTLLETVPQVRDGRIVVTSEDGRVLPYRSGDIGDRIDCCDNPNCGGGGFTTYDILRKMVDGREERRTHAGTCAGTERPPGRRCMRTFTAVVTLTYRPAATPPATD